MVAFCLAIAGGLLAATSAPAVTLKLAFPDAQAMTHGSACSGEGCLERGVGVQPTDAAGEVLLDDTPDRIVEYRRDDIDLAQAPPGTASGRVRDVGARTTVVLPRLLSGSAPDVDAAEADVVARINAERSARGLALAVRNARLSAAADLHATWLDGGAIGLPLPLLSHVGPFGTTTAFRLGEVSFPVPTGGSEIAAAGSTPAEAITMWLASAPHRDQLLAPGAPLIGVGMVGRVIIVVTHPPCRGCEQPPPTGGAAGALTPTGVSPAPTGTPPKPGSPAVTGSGGGGARASSCGAERLSLRRLRPLHGRLRVRVGVRCLRPGATYALSVLQRPSRSTLTTRRIRRAGSVTLALRPARGTRTLRIKLKRNGRAVAARSLARRSAVRP